MNLSNAVGAAAGLALVAILGVSVLKAPESAGTVVVAATDAPGSSPLTVAVPSSSAEVTGSVPDSMGVTAPDQVTAPKAGTAGPTTTQATPTGARGTSPSTAAGSKAPLATSVPSVAAGSTSPAATGTSAAAGAIDKPSVRLGVVNASGKSGVATSTSTMLTKLGWSPKAESESWPTMGFSVVYYAAGKQDAALAVAESLGLKPEIAVAGDDAAQWTNFASEHYDVLVLAGKDLR